MEQKGQNPPVHGEVPGVGEDFIRHALRAVVGRARRLKSTKSDHEIGVRLHKRGESGELEEVYDGPINDLDFKRAQDERIIVKLKDSAAQELKDHPLRDGIILGAGTLMLLGAGLYVRHKHKKKQ